MNQISQNNDSGDFKDHFSNHAASYAKYRPTYPDSLFQFLAAKCSQNKLVWDCATGSGQSALALANYFDKVQASDASQQQIANARQHPKVTYQTATAENSGLTDESLDLICVAQAAHWFDISAFYDECKRVSKSHGLLAIWCYELFSISSAIDDTIYQLYQDILGNYWPPERKLVETGYRDLDFPFTQLATPEFRMEADWDLAQTLGYLNSWSACQKYQQQHQQDPITLISEQMTKLWGEPQKKKKVTWPLSLKLGYVH